jgi:hypothetical protein
MALLTCHVASEVLEVATTFSAIVPEEVESPPVLYLLHGLTDDHTGWTRSSPPASRAAPAVPPLYVGCGTSDGFLEANERFITAATDAGVDLAGAPPPRETADEITRHADHSRTSSAVSSARPRRRASLCWPEAVNVDSRSSAYQAWMRSGSCARPRLASASRRMLIGVRSTSCDVYPRRR